MSSVGDRQVEAARHLCAGHREPVLLGEAPVGVVFAPVERIGRLAEGGRSAVGGRLIHQPLEQRAAHALATMVRSHEHLEEGHRRVIEEWVEHQAAAEEHRWLGFVECADGEGQLADRFLQVAEALLLRPHRSIDVLGELGGPEADVVRVPLVAVLEVDRSDTHSGEPRERLDPGLLVFAQPVRHRSSPRVSRPSYRRCAPAAGPRGRCVGRTPRSCAGRSSAG